MDLLSYMESDIMTKEQFINSIVELGYDRDYVKFNDSVSDNVMCINQNYHVWEVFYRERGCEVGMEKFESESMALDYLYFKLKKYNMK